MFKKILNQKGFSLVEIILVVVIVGFIVLLLVNLPSSVSLIGTSNNTSLAKDIAASKIENLRSQGYSNLALGVDQPFSDSRLSSLYQGLGTYTIEDCQDPVCNSQEISNQISLKQVTVKITWKEKDLTKEVKLQTLVAEGGLQ